MTTPKHVSGTIKALQWDDFEGQGAKAKAYGSFNYLITRWSDGRFEICESYPGHQGAYIGDGFYPSLDAAKAAAQADYNARILAAIQPDHEPVVQCCMCGKKGLSTVEGDGGEECQLHDDRWTCSRVCYDKATEPEPQPAAAVGDGIKGGVRFTSPKGKTREEMREWLRTSEEGKALYQLGDCILVWANEGDLYEQLIAPFSAGTVSVEAAAKVLLDACPNPIFDQLKPVLMGEVTERVGYTDEDGNEAYYDRPVSWDAMKTIISAALRALAGDNP